MDPRPIATIVDRAVTTLPSGPLLGNALAFLVAFLVAFLAFCAIGAVLFLWRRNRVRRYGDT
jgi:hypothetical protein